MNNIFTTTDHYGRSVYETVQAAPNRFYARFLQYLPHTPLTPEQQAECDASEAEYRAMCDAFGHTPDDEQFGCMFVTEAAAQRAVELHDAMSFACDDISAFGAGGMGFEKQVCDPLERELDELETMYGAPPATDPYREAFGHARDATLREVLGIPGGIVPDDYDILVALGERPALH
jgi:hypothetical protein